ncbi:MAG: hypothetical protein OEZ22_08655 [Spirochaetia bacterium]|nr:hypothetical protein [Spirochaetia bacterium]
MYFICKILRHCLNNDGVFEYVFKKEIKIALLEFIKKTENNKNIQLETKKIGTRNYMRFFHPHYKMYGFENDKKLRVEFEDFHPFETKDKLEDSFTQCLDQEK